MNPIQDNHETLEEMEVLREDKHHNVEDKYTSALFDQDVHIILYIPSPMPMDRICTIEWCPYVGKDFWEHQAREKLHYTGSDFGRYDLSTRDTYIYTMLSNIYFSYAGMEEYIPYYECLRRAVRRALGSCNTYLIQSTSSNQGTSSQSNTQGIPGQLSTQSIPGQSSIQSTSSQSNIQSTSTQNVHNISEQSTPQSIHYNLCGQNPFAEYSYIFSALDQDQTVMYYCTKYNVSSSDYIRLIVELLAEAGKQGDAYKLSFTVPNGVQALLQGAAQGGHVNIIKRNTRIIVNRHMVQDLGMRAAYYGHSNVIQYLRSEYVLSSDTLHLWAEYAAKGGQVTTMANLSKHRSISANICTLLANRHFSAVDSILESLHPERIQDTIRDCMYANQRVYPIWVYKYLLLHRGSIDDLSLSLILLPESVKQASVRELSMVTSLLHKEGKI